MDRHRLHHGLVRVRDDRHGGRQGMNGIHTHMTEADYAALPAVSRSDLFRWAMGEKDCDDRRLFIGTLFHRMMLEPDRVGDIAVCESRRNTKAWIAFVAENVDKDIVTTGEFDMLRAMKLSVEQNPDVSPLRDYARANRDRCEMVVVAPVFGVMMKARLDLVTTKAIIDWKTTSCTEPSEFGNSVEAFDYDVQAWLYTALYLEATGQHLQFAFACVSKRKDQGCPCWIHHVDTNEFGGRMAKRLIDIWKHHNPEHPAVIKEIDNEDK
jgi:hypothetical protein